MVQQHKLIVAIILMVVTLLGWQVLFPGRPSISSGQRQATQVPNSPATSLSSGGARAAAVAPALRLRIATPSLNGLVSLLGARLDNLKLARYHESSEPKSPQITAKRSPRRSKSCLRNHFLRFCNAA
jgi:YidC/Oxa1 family membrane protein insertase